VFTTQNVEMKTKINWQLNLKFGKKIGIFFLGERGRGKGGGDGDGAERMRTTFIIRNVDRYSGAAVRGSNGVAGRIRPKKY